jgi:hypothetical protein
VDLKYLWNLLILSHGWVVLSKKKKNHGWGLFFFEVMVGDLRI